MIHAYLAYVLKIVGKPPKKKGDKVKTQPQYILTFVPNDSDKALEWQKKFDTAKFTSIDATTEEKRKQTSNKQLTEICSWLAKNEFVPAGSFQAERIYYKA